MTRFSIKQVSDAIAEINATPGVEPLVFVIPINKVAMDRVGISAAQLEASTQAKLEGHLTNILGANAYPVCACPAGSYDRGAVHMPYCPCYDEDPLCTCPIEPRGADLRTGHLTNCPKGQDILNRRQIGDIGASPDTSS